jgi:DNA helicase-2/ATP-dependent DNA helicase PcrA
MLNLNNLNKEQREAVVHGEGPLLIVAGAGTGKTTVIIQRIAYLIDPPAGGGVKPEEILAVTFTDKAAEEMEERADKALPYGYIDLWISTFHSFCERILKEHALDIGLTTDFKLLDQTASWLLVRQNLDKFKLDYYKPLGNPTKFIHALVSHFSRCKDQGIYPEDYLNYCEKLKTNLTDIPEDHESERIKEIAEAYHVYQRLILENGFLDFGDLINYCLKLFQKRPSILEKYKQKFKYILVDEFQDTNWAQYELVKMLVNKNNNLTVTADDDQAIYRWRGASYNNIIQFRKDFPKTKEVFLVKNYRSRQNILDLCYKFIKANDPNRLEYISKIDKKLIAFKKGKGIVEHLHFKDLEKETQGVVYKIIEILKKDKESTLSDFAILVRANESANAFIREMERAKISYQFLASRGLYSKPVILDIISYLKLLDNYHEGSAVYRVLNFPFLGISSEDIIRINQYSRKRGKSIYEALEELPLISGVSQKSADKINFLLSLIKKHAEFSRKKNIYEILLTFLKESGYLKHLTDKESHKELDLINQFTKKVKEFEESSLDPTLKNFMEQLILELESGEQGSLEFDIEQGPDIVRIMTIHSSKGLEFKYVFLVNLVDKRFPTMERKEKIEIPKELAKDIIPEGDIHLEEERRLCYVAMTRAKKGLFFTSADDYGGTRKKRLSRFLIEMGFGSKEEKPAFTETKKIKELAGSRKKKKMKTLLPPYFSFSQLIAFKSCPLQYKFAHILKVPLRGRPVFSFGKTIHSTLYEFLRLSNERGQAEQADLFSGSSGRKRIKDSDEKEISLSFEDLIKIYNQKWIDEWYENKNQKDEYRKLGRQILKDFYSQFEKDKPKVLRINNQLALELPFNLKIGDYTLKGKIDRIDELEDGVEIMDYKTGGFKEKLSFEDKQQLLIYQIASESVFNLKPSMLSYYYLEKGERISFLGDEKEKEKQKEQILSQIEAIRKSDFGPTPGWQCKFCDFRDICNYAQR